MTNPLFQYSIDYNIKLRDIQVDILNTIWENYKNYNTFAMEISVGGGKSLIAASIAYYEKSTRIITSSNQLVDQYYKDYSHIINKFYGLSNYLKKEEYLEDKVNAITLENPVVTNTIAHLLLTQLDGYVSPKVMVIDECDASIGLLDLYFTKVFNLDKVARTIEELDSYKNCLEFIEGKIRDAEEQMMIVNTKKRAAFKTGANALSKVVNLRLLYNALVDSPEMFSIWRTRKRVLMGKNTFYKYDLNIKAINIPVGILQNFLGYTGKVILMSGTLFNHEIPELLPDRKYLYISVPSPISVVRRQVLVAPSSIELVFPRDYEKIAQELERTLETYKYLRPCLVHLSYTDAKEVSKYMTTPHIVYEDKIEKIEAVKEFMEKKGDSVLLGPGLSIGVDLKNDLCRLNIIPILKFPNIKDDYVEKKMAQAFGRRWYATQTIRETVQAVGRSTRGPEDYSLAVISDPRFARFYNEWGSLFPSYFKEAIVWDEKLLDKTYISEVEFNKQETL